MKLFLLSAIKFLGLLLISTTGSAIYYKH